MEPDCFSRVQSTVFSHKVHLFGFGAWLFYTGTKLSVVQKQIALDLGPNDFT